MKTINVIKTGILALCSAGLQASPITLTIIQASNMDTMQWQAAHDVWIVSFYNAYKDLPFDQVDDDIQDASKKSLIDYLQRRFDKYRLLAIRNSYSLALAYKDEQLAGYTLYHMLDDRPIVHIDHFAVDPNCQGQGIGKKLLESTIQSKPEITSVVLTTRILNSPAQKFYKQQGFYELDSIEGLEFDARYSILLRKDIEASALITPK